MRIKIAISIITLVFSFIIILILIENDSKNESSASSPFSLTPVSSPFSSIPVQSVLKFAYALEDNKNNSGSDNITNITSVDEYVEKGITLADMGNYQEDSQVN